MNLQSLIDLALAEDIGPGDLTSRLLIPAGARAKMRFQARTPLVMAGGEAAAQVFRTVDNALSVHIAVSDGTQVQPGAMLMDIEGSARSLLAAERVALNLLQRACGVATQTRRFVDAAAGTKAAILDTRKTMPGLRVLDKYAVTCGGGRNHRLGLYDAVLIKDNHIALCGGVKEAVEQAREGLAQNKKKIFEGAHDTPSPLEGEGMSAEALAKADWGGGIQPIPLIVECDTLSQVEEALAAGPDRILLDNMDTHTLKEAVALAAGRIPLEASGGVTLGNVRAIAETGVDFISVGALTHSAPAADIGAEVDIARYVV